MDIQDLESVEAAARSWSLRHYPDGSSLHHAAFVNGVTYALFRFTGRFGGTSIRDHVVNEQLNDSGKDWTQEPIESLYQFVAESVHGPIQDQHVRTWIMMEDICHGNDPVDVKILNERAKDFSLTKSGRFATMRVWEPTLRKLHIIAAMRNESMVECVDRLANEEYARLRIGLHSE